MSSDAAAPFVALTSFTAIAAALVFAALYAIFGKPSTPSGGPQLMSSSSTVISHYVAPGTDLILCCWPIASLAFVLLENLN